MTACRPLLTKLMTLVVGLALCGIPECAQAWQDNAASPQNQQQQPNGATIDPSQGPLQPVPSQNQPNTPAPEPNQNTGTTPAPLPATPQPRPEQQMQQPLGAATAEGVPVVGGGASRPAGAAIAPAKQNQRRSLLIKLGLIAAVGVAGGTVYALSKSSPSRP